MERIDRDVRRNPDMESMLSDSLETVRLAFGADRSWLLFPCDPGESSFGVPMERTAPEFPGLGVQGVSVPITNDTKEFFNLALEASGPIAFDPVSGRDVPTETAKQFGVKSQLVAAIYPRVGKPWLMGMHQCSSARVWNSAERQLFKEASRRISDALSNLLMRRELKASEEKFRTFSEQTMLGICVVQDNLIIFANQAYCDIFEMTVEEMLALPPAGFLALVHPDDREFLMEQARKKQAGASGVVPSYSWRAITKTGKMRWVEIHSRTVTLDGRNAVLVSLLDITEIRHSREGLEQLIEERTSDLARKASELEVANERLTLLDKLKSSFITTVSHDLRTPLTSVLGYAKLIRKDLFKALPFHDCSDDVENPAMDRIMANLEVMESEGARLTSLISEFMDLTAMEAGTATWYDKQISVENCIRRAVEKGERMIAGKPGLTFVFNMTGNLPKMTVDPNRMEQALGNLIDNAIRYTLKGTITVTAESPDGQSLMVAVSDTGKGIPDGEMEAIFEPFHQVELGDTLVDEIKGSGLGLSISRKIIEHYGGAIRVESYLGKGSTFTVELPGNPLAG